MGRRVIHAAPRCGNASAAEAPVSSPSRLRQLQSGRVLTRALSINKLPQSELPPEHPTGYTPERGKGAHLFFSREETCLARADHPRGLDHSGFCHHPAANELHRGRYSLLCGKDLAARVRVGVCSRSHLLGSRRDARVSANVLLRDLDLCGINVQEQRRIEVIVEGLTAFHGAQLVIDATLVSALRADGAPHRRRADESGVAWEAA